ncbi:hypothetical protein [Streptacidiphilus jiangxiensis]|uniref:DUF2975 domain-containing protein n=1 Tax=Streptacidiphilus jiangxiensis TaxID=235985 RepID=A0A1H7TNX9_STRJI|nr:hypothetical protein [Streptacidiphilus jiangxiensis]SEL86550.1 hypothetical protein SAMN05414137_114119 [Streptacidiphilus jiangxiensis]
MTEEPKLLEPLATAVGFVLKLVIALLALGFVLSLFNSNVHVGWSSGNVCATDQNFLSSTSGDSTLDQMEFLPKGGATVGLHPQFCTSNPSGFQRLLVTFEQLPTLLMAVGSLLWLNALLRRAARDGVYTLRTTAGIKRFGWWLLVGSLVVSAAKAAAQAALLATLTGRATSTAASWLSTWSFPTGMVFTALGLFTFARILRAGAAMREDLEGTV